LGLANEVIRSIAAAYHWPDFQPKVRTMVTVDPKIFASYVGTYEVRPNFDLVVTVQDGHLVTQATGQDSFSMLAESETKFFPAAFDAEVEFFKDAQGNISYAMLRQNGHETKAVKK
jgi:Domain of unknown function (DUF3471)